MRKDTTKLKYISLNYCIENQDLTSKHWVHLFKYNFLIILTGPNKLKSMFISLDMYAMYIFTLALLFGIKYYNVSLYRVYFRGSLYIQIRIYLSWQFSNDYSKLTCFIKDQCASSCVCLLIGPKYTYTCHSL